MLHFLNVISRFLFVSVLLLLFITDLWLMSKRKGGPFEIMEQQQQNKKLRINHKWEHIDDSVYALRDAAHACDPARSLLKIAAFDMDGTLIRPSNGQAHSKTCSDWEWWDPTVKDTLEGLHRDGFQIVVLSNQKGISVGKVEVETLKSKIGSMLSQLNIPVSFFLASKADVYRKPNRGMWDLVLDMFLASDRTYSSTEVDTLVNWEESFYCGDAAGRFPLKKVAKKSASPMVSGPHNNYEIFVKDHSDTDRGFAFNLSLKFFTPEEFFLKRPAPRSESWKWKQAPLFDESASGISSPLPVMDSIKLSTTQELVVMVGPPGCGKSRIAKTLEKISSGSNVPYVRVNRDDLKTDAKCEALLRRSLGEGKSVIIDNTNGQAETRIRWLSVAKEYKVSQLRCVYVQCEKETAMSMSRLRNCVTRGLIPNIPDVVFHTYYKRFEGTICPPLMKM